MGTSKTENRETLLISSPVPIICRIFHGTCARVGWKEGETWHRLSFSSFLLLLALSLITHPARPGTSVIDTSYRVVVTKLFPFTGATFSQNSFAINIFISLNSHLFSNALLVRCLRQNVKQSLMKYSINWFGTTNEKMAGDQCKCASF